MSIHKITKKTFSGVSYNTKPQSCLFKYPEIDHIVTYCQKSIGQCGPPKSKQMFLVSYSYYPNNKEDYNQWKQKVEAFGYLVYIEKCKYADMNAHMVLVAEKEVNLDEAINYIHNNPHPNKQITFY